MSQVHAVRRNPFSRLLGEAGIAFLCGLIFSGAEIGSLPSPLPLVIDYLCTAIFTQLSFGCIFITLHGRLYAVQWDFIVFFDEWHCTGFLAIRHDGMPNRYNCMVFTYGFAGIAKSTENSAQICNRLCSGNCLYSLHCCVDLF